MTQKSLFWAFGPTYFKSASVYFSVLVTKVLECVDNIDILILHVLSLCKIINLVTYKKSIL